MRAFQPATFGVGLLLAGLILVAAPAHADTVKLTNGDVITGTVKKLADGSLIVKTEYAGEISIESEFIAAVQTDQPFTVRWDDGSEKVGRLTITADGRIDVVGGSTPTDTTAAEPAEGAHVVSAEAVPSEAAQPAADAVVAAPEAPEKESVPAEIAAEADAVEEDASRALAAVEPTEAPSQEYEEAERAAAEATAAAIEYAEEHGEGPVAAESDAVDMAKVYSLKPILPYYRYEGSFNVGFNAARGNTDTTDTHIDGKIVPSFGRNTIAFGGELNRSEANGVTNKSNWTIRAEYDREFGVRRRWYGNVFNTYENDELANLNLRVTAGAGVGYKFFNERPTLLRISLGPAYVNEDWRIETDRTFLGLRWNLNFERDLWTEDFTFYHSDTMTFGLSETQYVLRTTTGLKLKLIADFAISAEFKYDYNAEPPPETLKSDQYYILKIGYDFRGDENDWFPQW